jgi:hypothetical protein
VDLDIHPRVGAQQHVRETFKIETTIEADDGQQYRVMLLDADDSFDIVVTYPNDEREIVFSLVRERADQ